MRLCRLFSVIYMSVAIIAASPAYAQGNKFVPELNDVPVLSGLAQMPGRGFSFESPSIRIAEVYFMTNLKPEFIETFYTKTLPQLGWTMVNASTFVREGERLTLLFEPGESEKTRIIRFLLTPNPPSPPARENPKEDS